jgi:hypothetical protein
MIYVLEAIGVGFYSVLLFLIFSTILHQLSIDVYLCLMITGFFKHFIGYYIGLQTWYCNNGATCISVHKKQTKYIGLPTNLFYNSIVESIFYLFFGLIFYFILLKILDKYLLQYIFIILYFLLGFFLHIFANHVGIHKSFCIHNCASIS